MLEYGADQNARDALGRSPLYLAAHSGFAQIEREFDSCADVTNLLLERGAELDIFTSPIVDRLDDLRQLLETDPALIHARDPAGNTPLHLAALNGKSAALRILLEKGAAINSPNNHGETPLSLAALGSRQSIVNDRGEPPIAAIRDGFREVVENLIDRSAACDVFSAARLGLVDRLESCLETDPDLANATLPDGCTLLRCATELWQWQGGNAMLKVVHLLLERGARPDIWTASALNQQEPVARLLSEDPALLHAFDGDLAPIHCAGTGSVTHNS